ncbi:adenylylsulfate reductase [Natroniella sulfidigena]|uniref:4Fe-4S dicluster domain-containing protein n=1 Tax=Natroniella sulfidigena TaxID=723921 RepID=UPI00200B3BD3|nr:4Fe-4S dicluster domain-containing protein [Natroniella sulfidigena]MCK8816109.1 adenylylsulfate reductase [Natroniella sulfidigena]
MAVEINKELCNGCGKSKEPLCVRICPGNLLYKNATDKAEIREKRDCWDCAACVKECPKQAIEICLPAEIGGRGSTLQAEKKDGKIIWYLNKVDGSVEKFKINV